MSKIFDFFCSVMQQEGKWEPDTWTPRIRLDWDTTGRVIATHGLGTITLNMRVVAAVILHQGNRLTEVVPMGTLLLEQVAHEWRHFQQEVLWETDIPQVSMGVRRAPGTPETVADGYWEDPGELDARQFASRALEAAPDDLIKAVGRLARMGIAHKVREASRKTS